jgi:hypothetical protein
MLTHSKRILLAIGVLVAAAQRAPAADPAQKTYTRPEDAVRALLDAARRDDDAGLIAILGPGSEDIVSSGDPISDRAERSRVVTAAGHGMRIETLPWGAAVARLGRDDWPLPIPIVKDGDRWRFDAAAARDELLNRRIGRNELKAIAVARVYVDAQRQHARRVGDYAQKLRSQPGARDGLYWDDPTGTDPSPIGPLLAEAAAEGYARPDPDAGPQPYHGYFFRILTEQGAHAPGGVKSYLKDGKMTGGFALVAYPAERGSSGVMTFIVGPQGIVYQKDLGNQTAEAVRTMKAYDPDDTWTPVRD